MRYSIGQAAERCGVSVRTLRYYDQIGLLKPADTGASGYRCYDESSLLRLREILFYRELDFSLEEIRRMLDTPAYDRARAMERQRRLLTLKCERLMGLIALLERNLKGEDTMNLSAFDDSAYQAEKERYAAEAKERWGQTEAYAQSEEKRRTHVQEQGLQRRMEELFARFAALREPESREGRELVEQWRRFISENYYECTPEILSDLGRMYAEDRRFQENIDRFGPGTARRMSQAIEAYCNKA
ncbi:MerR family transcriptional regulator [Oscillibacter sp. MSJ-2]|uniref:MerR family transcriptional regulator n=1 Tax=Dysosmobacter acutus TaxID=2841504 RepID=A0ABS6F8R1_9FIRM|nr:MerR family transcriptional regulator [Dysosmobacter acutus]MBU5626676.1 MerR family transcriptional regulator [Dysosmobacter acutus]